MEGGHYTLEQMVDAATGFGEKRAIELGVERIYVNIVPVPVPRLNDASGFRHHNGSVYLYARDTPFTGIPPQCSGAMESGKDIVDQTQFFEK